MDNKNKNAMPPEDFAPLYKIAAVMIAAYPMYRKMVRRAKAKYAPRILELTDELSEKNEF